MVFLKEDGSLDMDKINNLPIKEFIEVIEDMTMEQYKEYTSKLPINEGRHTAKEVEFYSLNEVLEKGIGFDLREYLNNWKNETKG